MTAVDIQIYDTTLRDGAQGEGISFSLYDKLQIAKRLDEIGAGPTTAVQFLWRARLIFSATLGSND